MVSVMSASPCYTELILDLRRKISYWLCSSQIILAIGMQILIPQSGFLPLTTSFLQCIHPQSKFGLPRVGRRGVIYFYSSFPAACTAGCKIATEVKGMFSFFISIFFLVFSAENCRLLSFLLPGCYAQSLWGCCHCFPIHFSSSALNARRSCFQLLLKDAHSSVTAALLFSRDYFVLP